MVWPWCVLLTVLSIGLVVDTAPVRHSGTPSMGRCSVRQLQGLPGRPTVIALGSSRVREGVDPHVLDHALAGLGDASVNMGRSGLSPIRSFVMLRDVLERGIRPRAVFYEIDLEALVAGQRQAPLSAPRFAAYLTWADVGRIADPYPDLTTLDRLRLTALTAMAKLGGATLALLAGGPLHAWDPPGAAIHCRSAEYDLMTAPPPGPTTAPPSIDAVGLRSRAARQELHYVSLARELCRRHGIALKVFRPKALHELPLSRASLATVRSVVPEYIEPSAEESSGTWPGYADSTHMGASARVAFSGWLAAQVRQGASP